MQTFRIEAKRIYTATISVIADSEESAIEQAKKIATDGWFTWNGAQYEFKNDSQICRNCKFAQPWECGSKVIYYCSQLRSNRTDNGLKKIKLKDAACTLFKKREVQDGI